MARSMPINRKTLYNVCPYLFFFKLSLDYASLAFLLSFQMRKKNLGKTRRPQACAFSRLVDDGRAIIADDIHSMFYCL